MTSATVTTLVAKIHGLVGGDYTLDVQSADLVLDEGRTPYGGLQLVTALPSAVILDQITPYAALRIQGTITHTWVSPARAPQTRTFDLVLHERTIDHEAGTLAIIAQTDEAMLIDRLNVSSTLARSYGLSVKAAVDYALTIIGAALEAGAVDAALTTKALKPNRTNLITNPAAEVNTTGATANGVTLSRDTVTPISGAASYKLVATGASSDDFISLGSGAIQHGMTATKTYTASGKIRLAAPITGLGVNALQVVFLYRIGAGAYVNVPSASAPNVAGTSRLSLTFTVPAGTTEAYVRFYLGGTGGTVWWDELLLEESAELGSYFDGSTADGLWTGSWSGTAHASTSVAVNQPNTDATIWKPGKSLDEWLKPILQAGNRRLFCDEHRKWRLVDSSYAVDGDVRISEGYNAKSATDTMSRQREEQGLPVWFDHVAVHYAWTDAAGVRQEAWEFASTGSVKGYLLEEDTPWPGPGAAAGILARANGRGRTQDATALTDYAATPGMNIVMTLPATSIQSGILSSVRWLWGENVDEMEVTSRGLTNTPADAWVLDAGPWSTAGGTWNVPV